MRIPENSEKLDQEETKERHPVVDILAIVPMPGGHRVAVSSVERLLGRVKWLLGVISRPETAQHLISCRRGGL